MLTLLAHLLTAKANNDAQNYCSYVCGSVGNYPNPSEQMNKLLSSGINCYSPYNPSNVGGSNGQDACILSNYGQPGQPGQPGQQGNFNYGNNWQQQPGSGSYPNQPQTSQDECEITVSTECKPRTSGSSNSIQTQPGSNIQTQPGNNFSISPYSRPENTGNNYMQGCDCSGQSGNTGNTGGMYTIPTYNGSNQYKVCDCSNQGGNGMRPYPRPNELGPGAIGGRPNFCYDNGSNGMYPGLGNKGMNNNIINAFDCNNIRTSPNFVMPKDTKTILVGTTELPAAENFRAYTSSCNSGAPCS